MRILAVVYACEPGRGSEPEVGWRLVHELAREHEVVAVTRANNRAAIEAAPRPPGGDNVEFLYCDAPRGLRLGKRRNRGVYRYQAVWQFFAFWAALRIHRRKRFDLVHALTFSASWYPSLFAFFPAPFLWGPLACNEPVPAPLAKRLLERTDRRRNTLRRFLNGPLSDWNPLVRFGRRRARRLIAVNADVAARIGRTQPSKVTILPAIGARDSAGGTIGESSSRPRDARVGNLRIAMVGRMIGLKGYTLAFHALARTSVAEIAELQCIGDGPLRPRLQRLTVELGIEPRVRFWGEQPHDETLNRIAAADVLLFPAFDAGGMVTVEAMARSVPVVALDTGGAAHALRDGAGVLIPVGDFDSVANSLAAALSGLAADPERRDRIGSAGRRRFLEEFEWSRKGEKLREIVREIECDAAAEVWTSG